MYYVDQILLLTKTLTHRAVSLDNYMFSCDCTVCVHVCLHVSVTALLACPFMSMSILTCSVKAEGKTLNHADPLKGPLCGSIATPVLTLSNYPIKGHI